MDEEALQSLVKRVSLADFHTPFQHQATFNGRLKTTGGRFHVQTGNLDFNPRMFAQITPQERLGIIRHELCHYHLYFAGRGYKHRDGDFRALLAQVDGSRYAPSIGIKAGWQYQCTQCGQRVVRQRRFDVKRYVCRRCRGRFVLVGPVSASL